MDNLEERIEVMENKLKDYDRYIQVLNDHSLYLSECVEKLSKGFEVMKDIIIPKDFEMSLDS